MTHSVAAKPHLVYVRQQMSSSSPSSSFRASVLAVAAVVVLGTGVALGVDHFGRSSEPELAPASTSALPPSPRATSASASSPLGPPATETKPVIAIPSFDVVLVSPDGGAVIAGRAEAGAAVTVYENGQVVGTARADNRGTWAMAPNTKLPPGAGELTLMAQTDTGIKAGDTPVLVLVPEPSKPGAAEPAIPPLAVLSPPVAPSRGRQPPSMSDAPRKLGIDTVDYDQHGAIQFSGSAPPNAPVRVYVDNVPIGEATAAETGHWAMSPSSQMRVGLHTLRLDQLGTDGRVLSRLEMPFQRETLSLSQMADGQVVVQPGQNLWLLARRAYGTGIRYTVIYRANLDQIRDPRRIYPGQVFNTPGASPPQAATPAGTPIVTPAIAR